MGVDTDLTIFLDVSGSESYSSSGHKSADGENLSGSSGSDAAEAIAL